MTTPPMSSDKIPDEIWRKIDSPPIDIGTPQTIMEWAQYADRLRCALAEALFARNQSGRTGAGDRETIRTALYEGLEWFGTLPEPEGDVPSRYHRWDDLGELADRIIAALKDTPAE